MRIDCKREGQPSQQSYGGGMEKDSAGRKEQRVCAPGGGNN